ncbi:MAG: hypothetical protein LBD31_02660 [Treponema sp.]|nr:hypothetical protein [Treponema sp.]
MFLRCFVRVSRRTLTPDDRRELSTTDENGGPVVLVFRKAAPAEISG